MNSILWIIGPPIVWKTTFAYALRDRIQLSGEHAVVLEGDELPQTPPTKDLDFTDQEHLENVRRAENLSCTALMALEKAEQGAIIIVVFVTSMANDRALVRSMLGDKVSFLQIDGPGALSNEHTADLQLPASALPMDACVHLVLEKLGLRRPLPLASPNSAVLLSTQVSGAPDVSSPEWVRVETELEPSGGIRTRRNRVTSFKGKDDSMVLGPAILLTIGALFYIAWLWFVSSDAGKAFLAGARQERAPHVPSLLARGDGTSTPPKSELSARMKPVLEDVQHFTPENKSAILQQAQALMSAYWNAPTWREKRLYVRDRDRVGPLMRTHYEELRAREPGSSPLESSKFQRIGAHEVLRLFYRATGKPSGPPIQALLVKQPEGTWLLDWEAFTASGERDWSSFIQQRNTQPTMLRAYAEISDYYNYEFTDEANLVCLRLESWDGANHLYSYCARDSETGDRVKNFQLAAGKGYGRVTVRLAFPENAQSGECVRLLEFIIDRWLLLE